MNIGFQFYLALFLALVIVIIVRRDATGGRGIPPPSLKDMVKKRGEKRGKRGGKGERRRKRGERERRKGKRTHTISWLTQFCHGATKIAIYSNSREL